MELQPRVRYETKRHWYEIAAETSDFVWWSAIIITMSLSLSQLVDRRAGWGVLLCLYPLGRLFAELVRWNLECFAVVDLPNGKSMFRQTVGVLTLLGVQERVKEDFTDHLAPTTYSTPFGRFLGFVSVTMSSASKQYFSGERVPKRLMDELRRNAGKMSEEPPDDERLYIAQNIGLWIDRGIIQPEEARTIAMSMIKDNL